MTLMTKGVGVRTSAAGSRQKAVARAASVAAGEVGVVVVAVVEEEEEVAAAVEEEVEVVEVVVVFDGIDGDVGGALLRHCVALRRPICVREQRAVDSTSTRRGV